MSNIIEKNKSFIIIGVGVLVVFGLFYYIKSKNNRMINYIDDLKQRIEDLEDIIQKLETNKQPPQMNFAQFPSQNLRPVTTQQQQNVPQTNNNDSFKKPDTSTKNEPINKRPEPVKKQSEPVKKQPEPVKKQPVQTKHISFNTQVEELEEDSDIDEDELDAELSEELKDLEEKDDLKVEEIEVE